MKNKIHKQPDNRKAAIANLNHKTIEDSWFCVFLSHCKRFEHLMVFIQMASAQSRLIIVDTSFINFQ